MKKKILAIILLILLLSFCSCGIFKTKVNVIRNDNNDRRKRAETTDISNDSSDVNDNPELSYTDTINTVDYTIEKRDNSYYAPDGTMIMEHYFDQVILEGSGDNIKRINDDITAEMNEYLRDPDSFSYYYDPDYPITSAYLLTCDAEVTYNKNGIFSIVYETNAYSGGASLDYNRYCKVYSIETGMLATMSEVTGIDEQTLINYIQVDTIYLLDTNYKGQMYENAYETILEYKLEDYDFCIIDGHIAVVFGLYTIGPHSFPPVTLVTNVTVNGTYEPYTN